MKRLILAFAILWFTAPFAQADNVALTNHIDTLVNERLTGPNVTGITLAAGKNGEVIFAKGYGIANIETGEPVTQSTKMRTGSVSKVYTTALIGKLLESNQINLEAPIQTYVPSFPKKRWPITLRDMAGHMSGIRHYRGNEFSSTKHYPTVLGGVAIFANDPLEFEPRTKSSYSSYAWNLISAALESAGKKPFLSLMSEQVFTQIGMAETQAEDVTKPINNIAAFHEVQNGETVIAPFVDNSYKWAGGGFVGTASDMARFGLAHTKAGFLSAETLTLLTTEQKTSTGKATGYGIGWMNASEITRRLTNAKKQALTANFSEKLMWHSGGSMGAVALLLVDPEHQSSVAIMANNSNSFSAILEIALSTLGYVKP